MKTQNFGVASLFRSRDANRCEDKAFCYPAEAGMHIWNALSEALNDYKKNRENGTDADSPIENFPTAGFELLNLSSSAHSSKGWVDRQGRYWWKFTFRNGQINEDFYWSMDKKRGWPDKENSNLYWFFVCHAPTGTKIEGFSHQVDQVKGYPDSKGNYWYCIKYTECGAIKGWMEKKDRNYLARIAHEQQSSKKNYYMKTQNYARTQSWCANSPVHLGGHLFDGSWHLSFHRILKSYRENRENGNLSDNPNRPFPSWEFENFDVKSSNAQPGGKWPDPQGRYWWQIILYNGQVIKDFYWTTDNQRGYPEKDSRGNNRYWYCVYHAPSGTKIAGFSDEPDYQKGFPDKKGKYWRYLQFTDTYSSTIAQWMKEKDANYLARLQGEEKAKEINCLAQEQKTKKEAEKHAKLEKTTHQEELMEKQSEEGENFLEYRSIHTKKERPIYSNSFFPSSSSSTSSASLNSIQIETGIETYNFKSNPVYSGLVTDLELAVLSAVVYKDIRSHTEAISEVTALEDKRLQWWRALHKNGWQVFRHVVGKDGFRAIAYIHDERKQVVIAFRGTEPNEPVTLWIDWEEVYNNAIGSHGEQAYNFTKVVRDALSEERKRIMLRGEFIPDAYQVTVTGHSLGAWIASIVCSISYYPAVVFDNPGAKKVVKAYREGKVIKDPDIPLISYQAMPNLINTAHEQIVGQCTFQLTTKAERRKHTGLSIKEISYTLEQHSIDLIVETFNPATGMPYRERVTQVKTWPCGGAKAGKALTALLPSSLRNATHLLCRWWFMRDLSYVEWIKLGSELLSSISEIPSISAKLIEITKALEKAYGIVSYDYMNLQDKLPENIEEEFKQRFKQHYHVEEFNTQSITPLFVHDEVVRLLKCVSKLRKQRNFLFPEKYAYLNEVKLEKDASSSAIVEIVIPKPSEMTAIDFRREVMKDMPILLGYLEKVTASYAPREGNGFSHSIPSPAENIIHRAGPFNELKRRFENKKIGIPKILSLFSPSGTGKTQLAIEFARQSYLCREYTAVIWIEAGNDVREAYNTFAERFHDKKIATWMKFEEKIHAVASILSEQYNSILFVFNNVNSYEEIRPYLLELPTSQRIHVLLTVQDQELASYYEAIFLDKFSEKEGIHYIQSALKGMNISEKEAKDFGKYVDFHPLSLSYLTTYVRAQNISLYELQKRYRAQGLRILQKSMEGHPNEKQGMAILLSLEQISKSSTLARKILDVCTFLVADDISESLLNEYFQEEASEEAIAIARQILNRYSFINLISNKPGYFYTHRFLQEILYYQLKQQPDILYNLQTTLLIFFEKKLNSYVEEFTSEKSNLQLKFELRQSFVHAQNLSFLISKEDISEGIKKTYVKLLLKVGNCFEFHAEYRKAQDCYERILKIYQSTCEEFFEPEQSISKKEYVPLTMAELRNSLEIAEMLAECLNNLGTVLGSQDDYLKAQKRYEEALKIYCEIIQNENSLEVAKCLTNLGNIFRIQGDYPKAKKHFEKALELYRTIHGNNQNHDVAHSLNNLGMLFASQNNYFESQKYFEKALRLYRTIYENEQYPHLDIALCLDSLGTVSIKQNDYRKAQHYFEQSLAIYRKIYGNEQHPDIAESLIKIGSSFRDQGNYSEWRKYYEQAFKILQTFYNEDHPTLILLLKDLKQIAELTEQQKNISMSSSSTSTYSIWNSAAAIGIGLGAVSICAAIIYGKK
jgi:tetratricopeptide (TPR) repeat protein